LGGSKNLQESWKTASEIVQMRLRRRRTIILVGTLFIIALGVFLCIYNFTDLISKPDRHIASIPAPGDWAMFQHDPLHSGSLNPDTAIPQGEVKSILTAGSEIRSSIAISKGILYVGSRDGKLYALDIATEKKIWDFQAGSWIDTSPAVVAGVVYFGSNDGNLYALNAFTGQTLWQFATKFPIKSSPAVAGGKVYFGTDDNLIFAVDAISGKKIWSVETGNYVVSSPVVSGGLVYTGGSDSYFYALDARNGRIHLKFSANKSVTSSAVVADGVVYFITNSGTLLAIKGDARNWPFENWIKPKWNILYVYSLAPAPPSTSGYLWFVDLKGISSSSPTISNGDLFVGAGNRVFSIDIQKRSQHWATAVGGEINSTPVVVGNHVYISCEDGNLYVLNVDSGEKLKAITLGGSLFASPVAANGVIYVGSTDGNLYAVK
jgi:eukaryotic-like serine/threonine-protein kinase